MTSHSRQWLVQSSERHLLTAFRERGFEVVPLTADETMSREYRTAFPLGHLRRPRADGIDLIEVQLDKRGGAAFRLNFGIAPKGGLKHPTFGFLAESDVNVQSLPQFYEVTAVRSFGAGSEFLGVGSDDQSVEGTSRNSSDRILI